MDGEAKQKVYFRYYGLYALRRAGELSGNPTLPRNNGQGVSWYRQGVEELLRTQQPDGSWRANNTMDGNPMLATSFALLYLADGKKLLK